MQESQPATTKTRPLNPCTTSQVIRSSKAVEAKSRDYNFSQDQPWVKTTRTLSFVDETTDIINIHDSSNFDTLENFDIGPDIDNASSQSSPPLVPLQTLQSNESTSYSDQDRSSSTKIIGVPSDTDHERPSKKQALSPSSTGIWESTPRLNPVDTVLPSQGSDDSRHFAAYSRTRSVESPILNSDIVLGVGSPQVAAALASSRRTDLPLPVDSVTEAISASAKRLSRIDGFDGLVVDRYHQNCLDALIPALSSSAAVMDENLLTAIVILRYMEELDVPLTSADTASESHLVGTRVFVAAQEKVLDFTGLRRAAFWVALRQDQSFSAWKRLQEAQERWWAERPWHFHPMYINEHPDSGSFPQALYLNDAVATGVLHYLLIQVLLAAHNPRIPKLGPGQAKAAKSINEEIRKTVKMVCGVAESNQRNPTGYAYGRPTLQLEILLWLTKLP
ncbi:hypothetical protein FBEOM_16 [Fusarium beomiforme]|uniref:Uncharacterized protein n=1 Tax=Fusarium beomiforme TaxID=44412 RepID=A0A9P5AWG3_9HYPO|nr:hypothetical protein FBEOM_16 [Fusarium beomiforme]